jgi:hypothetical protein
MVRERTCNPEIFQMDKAKVARELLKVAWDLTAAGGVELLAVARDLTGAEDEEQTALYDYRKQLKDAFGKVKNIDRKVITSPEGKKALRLIEKAENAIVDVFKGIRL